MVCDCGTVFPGHIYLFSLPYIRKKYEKICSVSFIDEDNSLYR